MHKALRKVLGTHVEQKGSLVNADYLRFDFSHFQKLSEEEIAMVEKLVNQDIQANITADISNNIPIEEAEEKGAMMLFGEKYGDLGRVVKFNDSIELCGGTHVAATGQIGLFKIVHESAIAAGIRRIEAYTGEKALDYLNSHLNTVVELKSILKNQKNVVKAVEQVISEQKKLQKQVDELLREKANNIKKELVNSIEDIGGIKWLGKVLDLDASSIKSLVFQLTKQYPNLLIALGSKQNGKASLSIALGSEALEKTDLKAGVIIRQASKEIQGGGGGQDHFATAGGNNPEGLDKAISVVKSAI
jgi:alanyl-tRNA synthetase